MNNATIHEVILILQFLLKKDVCSLVCKLWHKATSIYCDFASRLLGESVRTHKKGNEYIVLSTRGTFADIYICTVQHYQYTVKAMDKTRQASLQNLRRLRREIKTHSTCLHPNIIQLYSVYQSDTTLYMLEEHARKGDLFDLVNTSPQMRLSSMQINFCCAQLVLSLRYLHLHNIIHRDLRLENVVILDNGYLKLIDFGNSKFLLGNQKTYTLCGVPESCAPEMLCTKGHSCPVDWWALGVLLFEITVGYSPFYSDNEMDIFARILKHGNNTFFEEIHSVLSIEKELKWVIKPLLLVDPNVRALALKAGSFAKLQHPYLTSLDWSKMITQKYKSPFMNIDIRKKQEYLLKHFPEGSKLSNRMAQIAWKRYCGCF